MKISILCPDMSSNCLGRAYILAKAIQKHYSVEIIGPAFGDGIWKPLAEDVSIKYTVITMQGRIKPYWLMKKLFEKIDGDLVYASKPNFPSFGIGLLLKVIKGKPVVLDVDDWELGFHHHTMRIISKPKVFKQLVSSALFLYRPGSYWTTLLLEKLSFWADDITVSNSYLKNKFGGTIIYHGRDVNIFDPKKYDKTTIRKKYGINRNSRIVIFFGTPRTHKGIEDLIDAVGLLQKENITLMIVGLNSQEQYSKLINKVAENKLGERFLGFGMQSFEKVPEFLAMADIVVIPQRKNTSSVGQMPAKVFDAMAMGKPIVATRVGDLPSVLEGCGLIYTAGNHMELADKIHLLFAEPGYAEKIGVLARQKCKKHFSIEAMEHSLVGLLKKYENKNETSK